MLVKEESDQYNVKSGSKDHGLINIFMAKTMVLAVIGSHKTHFIRPVF